MMPISFFRTWPKGIRKRHGRSNSTTNNIFVIGGALKQKGVYNKTPDLSVLQDGDLVHEIDFRQVYATMLSNWMDVDADKILQRSFQKLLFA
jgi:uncharacterized protein (DUF1501 family)